MKKIKRKSRKATGVQSLNRQNVIFKLLLEGRPRRYIIKYCKDKWNISHDQVDKYIKKCNDAWAQASRFDRQSELTKEIERTEEILRATVKRKSYQTALSALKHLATLKRLNNLEIDFKGAVTLESRMEGMSDEEIGKIEQEICTRLTQVGINIKRKGTPKDSEGSGG